MSAPRIAAGDLDQVSAATVVARALGLPGEEGRVVAPHVGEEARLRIKAWQLRRDNQRDQLAVSEDRARPRPGVVGAAASWYSSSVRA